EVISRVKGGEGERFEAWLEKFLKISISMEQERRRIKEETKIRESNLREEERRNITRSFMQIDNEGNALEDKYFAHLNEPVPKVISKDIPKYKDKKIKALVIDIFNENKTPIVKDYDKGQYELSRTERLPSFGNNEESKLKDAIALLERKQKLLDVYAQQQKLPSREALVLIITKNIKHAEE
ncbi:31516_t:CDS:2, partial [Racocetra persica]